MEKLIWDKVREFLEVLRCEDVDRESIVNIRELQEAEQILSDKRDVYQQCIVNFQKGDQEQINDYIDALKAYSYEECQQAYLQGIPDFKTAKEQMPEIDGRWKQLNQVLKIGEDFLLKNREGFMRFLCEGGAEIFHAFLSGALESEREKAKRLCAADIAGRFREVKYYKNDLEREIALRLPAEIQQVWMKNMEMKRKPMRLWEEDRLLPVMCRSGKCSDIPAFLTGMGNIRAACYPVLMRIRRWYISPWEGHWCSGRSSALRKGHFTESAGNDVVCSLRISPRRIQERKQ